ncbi:hypothetical protein [uncultured Nostoc sp.]|uniref:hypothetical protein n=1 Tax=uncultured Nostoc sp. TaxID=340711 RepID=UPI00260D1C56|nr:hypothetical protein [uncultured Nostoc sp.]
MCKAYRDKTEKCDRFNSAFPVLNSEFRVPNENVPVESSTFRVLRWNDGVVKAIALIKFLGECCAIANPQLTSVSFYLYGQR